MSTEQFLAALPAREEIRNRLIAKHEAKLAKLNAKHEAALDRLLRNETVMMVEEIIRVTAS